MSFHIFFCGECELYQFLTYIMQMWTENFSWFTFYGIYYRVGNYSAEDKRISSGSLFDHVEKDCEIDEDDDFVSILSQ